LQPISAKAKEVPVESDLTTLTDRVARIERHNRLLLRVIALLLALMAMTLLVGQEEFRQLRSDVVRLLGRTVGASREAALDLPAAKD